MPSMLVLSGETDQFTSLEHLMLMPYLTSMLIVFADLLQIESKLRTYLPPEMFLGSLNMSQLHLTQR